MTHAVVVRPVPPFIDARRWLGPFEWQLSVDAHGVPSATCELERADAADLSARLRGVVLAGVRIELSIAPPLPRSAVRAARLDEARRHRVRSPGFTHRAARVDDDARLGLTPEALALALGQRARSLAERAHVVDACCGAGGNTIGFARAGCSVTAIELDAARLELARHNAALYGVAERIAWLHGDARDLLPQQPATLWFIDVPFAERTPQGRLPLLDALLALRPSKQRAWLKVPADFDPASIAGARPEAWFGVGEGDAQRVKFLVLELS
jgi:SAM-dependent methyltransferase